MDKALQQAEEFCKFQDKYNGKEFNGKVHWFDGMRGEGIVKLDDGTRLYCHFTAIQGVDKNNYHWPAEGDQQWLDKLGGRRCKVIPYITVGYIGCDKVTLEGK